MAIALLPLTLTILVILQGIPTYMQYAYKIMMLVYKCSNIAMCAGLQKSIMFAQIRIYVLKVIISFCNLHKFLCISQIIFILLAKPNCWLWLCKVKKSNHFCAGMWLIFARSNVCICMYIYSVLKNL